MPRVAPMWFRKKAQPVWERYILPMRDQIKRYLEIGTGEGGSVRWVLQNLPVELAVTVDPFAGQMAGREVSARLYLEKWLPGPPLRMVEEQSLSYLASRIRACPEYRFDFVYIDGDHDALPCLTDCVLAWALLKAGGIMAMDDYDRTWKMSRRGVNVPRTKQGIEGFLTAATGQYDILFEEPFQVAVLKR